ncbi:MAG TPA: polysaccharide deacetylase family protein [Clostridia bacterium]|nr:polysaccharide deacetylase family protein [Clostridia bacterium]
MLGAIAAITGAAAAASFAGLHTMVPWSQLYGRNFTGIAPGSRQLALTYDDGPNDPYTPQMLDVLARHDARATFFLLGQFVRQKPAIVRDIVAAGHAIGNHSWSHPNLIFASPAELRRQIEDTTKAIEDACGVTPKLFRPPYGGRRPGTFSVARKYGMAVIMWRVTCHDWDAVSNESIEAKAHAQIRGGDVILLHDGGHERIGIDRSHTVRATDNLITHYKAQGYGFVTVPEMMRADVGRPAADAN